jgi:NAD(P)-dependent dehydrogenase (short-subunit alcohol dehydrogenase family)
MSGKDHRSIVITGSGGGIGRALSLAAGAAGMRVFGLDVAEDAGQETVRLVTERGGQAHFQRCDIQQPDELAEAFAVIEREGGPVDVLINNAALGSHTAPEDLTFEEWSRVLGVTLTGSVFAAQQAGRSMIRAGRGGAIVNVASIAGLASLGRNNFAYGIAKAGVVGLTRELAVEWAGYGIRANAIAPSQVDTEGFRPLINNPDVAGGGILQEALAGIPLSRLATVDDIVPLVLFLASDAASFLTGITVPVDGGSMALHAGGTLRGRRN